jgi:transposase
VVAARRIWSRSEKRQILEEASVSGVNVSAVARRHGVAQSLLYRWRKDAATEDGDKTPLFVPVALPAPQTALVTDVAVRPASLIEIELACGRTVRAGCDVDPQVLAQIVAALDAHR